MDTAVELEVDMLPRLQRATLRATFEYLAGVDLPTAAAADGGDARRGHGAPRGFGRTSTSPRRRICAPSSQPARGAFGCSPTGRTRSRPWVVSSGRGSARRGGFRSSRCEPRCPARPSTTCAAARARWAAAGTGRGWDLFPVLASGVSMAGLGSRDPLLDEATTLLFAGHDTQSATLSWALLRLAGDPVAQRELRASLADDPVAMESLAGESGVPANRVVADERGRAGARGVPPRDPPAPPRGAVRGEEADERRGPRERGDDDGGDALTLPAGCAAGVWLHAVHRDPAVWVDPDSFDPSRWLITDSNSIDSSKKGSIRSQGSDGVRVRFKGLPGSCRSRPGPRACVGQHLAWVYMRVVLARLVCAYEVRLAGGEGEGDALTPSVGFTVTPANAARVRLVPTGAECTTALLARADE